MSKEMIIFVAIAFVFDIFIIYNKVQDYISDKDFNMKLNKLMAKTDYNLIKCNEALKNYGTSTEEASSSFDKLAKALDSPIITINEVRKQMGYEVIDDYDDYTIDYTGRYICPACGTMYIHEGGGFIPNCKNCGSRLIEEMIIKKEY